MFGRFFHWTLDAVLISLALAGIKRSTGLTPSLARIGSKDLRALFVQYLEIGEWSMDLAIVAMGRSSAFERRR